MAKILKVIDPFLRLDFGDTFELSEDGENYTSNVEENFTDVRDNGSEFTTKYNANFTISKDYAEQMIKDGYLAPVTAEKKDKTNSFVNVFGEIDDLLERYTSELSNSDQWDMPAECMKVEKITVLENIIHVLEHLKSLKKN